MSTNNILPATTFMSVHTPQSGKAESFPIPAGAQVWLEYLAEGAANVVYRIHVLQASLDVLLLGKYVLRLSKKEGGGNATKQAVHDFEKRILPLFDQSLLLEHVLYKLPHDIPARLNSSLLQLEVAGQRPKKRCGSFLPSASTDQELYGILMPDLSVQDRAQRLIEFKPKWLEQSPSAPRGAKCCRTCALKDMRDAADQTPGRGDSGFCPLDLLSSDIQVLTGVLEHVWPFDSTALSKFVAEFQTKIQPAILNLRELQRQYNRVGLVDFQQGQGDFSLAMAIRDCSVLMQVSDIRGDNSMNTVIGTFKLADLDLKATNRGKLEYWADTEKKLIDEGWYTLQGIASSQSRCALARSAG